MRKFAVGLDYNLVSFDVENDVMRVFRNIGDYFRLPAPGMTVNPGKRPDFKPILLN